MSPVMRWIRAGDGCPYLLQGSATKPLSWPTTEDAGTSFTEGFPGLTAPVQKQQVISPTDKHPKTEHVNECRGQASKEGGNHPWEMLASFRLDVQGPSFISYVFRIPHHPEHLQIVSRCSIGLPSEKKSLALQTSHWVHCYLTPTQMFMVMELMPERYIENVHKYKGCFSVPLATC